MATGLTRLVAPARRWLPLPALCLAVLVSYLPAMLWGGFVWDDFVVNTEPVRELSGLRQIWFSPGDIEAEGHYWPLVYTTFWLEHRLWGSAPAGYHVVNVLLHLANTLLLCQLLRRLALPGAWLVAAVFAVHPLHVESVAWVIERKDVLSGLFYLAAATLWIRFADEPRPAPGRYLGALALYAAGMLSKSVVVTLPVALLILIWWQRGRVAWIDVRRLAPFFLAGLAISVGDLMFNRSQAVARFDYSVLERALIAARAVWFYVGKTWWPLDLAVIYPHWEVRVDDALAWAGVVAIVGVLAALWLLRDRIGRGPLAGIVYFGVTLSPTLGFVDYNFMLFSFVADRFQYLAGIGLVAVVIGAAAHGITAARRVGKLSLAELNGVLVLVMAVLVVLATLTWRQAGIYRDGITFFNHVISYNPLAREAHLNLGSALLRWNRLEEALAAYRVAEQQLPYDYKPPFGAGLALYHLGRHEEAAEAYSRALQLYPRHAGSLVGLGEVRLDQQRYEDALQLLRTAVEIDPRNVDAWTNRGLALHHLGRADEALQSIDRALALDPNHKTAQEARSQVLQGSEQEAGTGSPR